MIVFFPHFQAMIESFVKDKKIEIVSDYDFDTNFPKELGIER